MQIINVLSKAELDVFKKGGMIQLMGTNPMIAYDSGGRVLRPAVSRSAEHVPRVNGKTYPCEKCGKVMPSRQSLGGHLAGHARLQNKRKLLTHRKEPA